MNTSKILSISLLLIFLGGSSSFAEMSTQLGFGYGKDYRDDVDLAQYEVFWRQPLSYTTTLGENWNVSTGVEFGTALIRESGSDNVGTARFSVMPQVMLSPNDMVNFIVGIGPGLMIGETEFTDHDLGGFFLLNSKIGIQFLLGEHWGVECVFYHQSNAGIYDHNASLNMPQISLSYNF